MCEKILAVCGYKNSGKTTLIERMLPLLTGKGLKVSVIKHDGHRFSPDVPGTDTWKFLKAGATGNAVFDGEKYMAVHYVKTDERTLAELFPEADLILLEGRKDSKWPKLFLENGVVRCSFSDQVFCRDDIPGVTEAVCCYFQKAGDAKFRNRCRGGLGRFPEGNGRGGC